MLEAIKELANDLHFSFFPRYICIEKFRDIPLNAIVYVEIDGDRVYFYYNKRLSVGNLFLLDMHFKKEVK